ncbi:hypothetical protein UFOVP964_138 [uncultured Caudovirales phage]|uniref:Uncharacterized protein n=1 Tax=uncultured Caudovirales phage TaxID=2100421 RepID=A0A6J5P5F5_9CAUD|nr:hypothetical protein UFOVP854_138 [uncultured Caudovirales phage]CAB4175236.1 hypothetical protein UFOVP964_138 [uncultured Caudovirales phage]CAB4178965.1 hypothetical protein UFOVP1034_20 [uncultured Caudovirales phage]CAB4189064.1 hypothetical protein UFOVP1177_20 [uncultured Caudovirales phage]CAB4193007.1 hypothetical protein UFOVP1243_7 [uncultured Caudovirales phage]
MPQFNTAQARFGPSNANPSNLANSLEQAAGNLMGNRPMSKKHVAVAKELMTHEAGVYKDVATHVGGIQNELNAQNNRHEMDQQVSRQNHENESKALDQHHEITKAQTEAGLAERAATQAHRHNMKATSVANTNATGFASHIASLAEGGTPVAFAHNDTNAKFTLKKETAPTPAQRAPRPTGPQQIGMPLNIATAGKPTVPAGPKPVVGRGPKGQAVSLNASKTSTPSAKKTASKKTAPTVTRGAGGRMTSLKKP